MCCWSARRTSPSSWAYRCSTPAPPIRPVWTPSRRPASVTGSYRACTSSRRTWIPMSSSKRGSRSSRCPGHDGRWKASSTVLAASRGTDDALPNDKDGTGTAYQPRHPCESRFVVTSAKALATTWGMTLTDLPAFAVHTITSGTEAEAVAHLQARGRSCLTAVSSGGAPSASGSSVLFTSRILLKHIAQLRLTTRPNNTLLRRFPRYACGHVCYDTCTWMWTASVPGWPVEERQAPAPGCQGWDVSCPGAPLS